MKTRIISNAFAPLGLALGMALSTWSWGAHNPTPAEQQRAKDESKQSDKWAALKAPMRGANRAGSTLWHTPSIIGETFRGERRVVSKRGFFARDPEFIAEKTPGVSADDQRMTLNQGRGKRVKIRDSRE